MLKHLARLEGRSFDELKTRASSGIFAGLERLGVSSLNCLPATRELSKQFGISDTCDEAALHVALISRQSVPFFQSFSKTAATVDVLRSRFPDDSADIITKADLICDGSINLLGYDEFHFGSSAPDWHRDPISNHILPKVHWSKIDVFDWAQKVDLKVIWELNRHQYFTVLGQAYLLTNDEKYSETFVKHISSWCDENPPKVGINWTSSLEVSFRAISWIWAFYLFRDSRSLQSDTTVRMLKFLYLHAKHLETYLSTYSSPNTHLTGEALGLYYIGTFLTEINGAKGWKKLGYDILVSALDFQVRDDGSYCEQSFHYHRYTVDFYLHLTILLQEAGEQIENILITKLNHLFDFLMFTVQPNGEMPLIGDDDGGRLAFFDNSKLTDIRGTLALGSALLRRGDLKFVARSPSAEILWLLGPRGLEAFDHLPANNPRSLSQAFKDGGFFVTRNSWEGDADVLLVNCGEHGFLNGGHAHADALAFVMSIGGEPVFVDSGTYKYASEPEARGVFRSTAAHNCLTVNGESSSIPAGPWTWESVAEGELGEWREDSNAAYFRGSHNGFGRFNVKYEREIVFRNDTSVTVTDFATSDNLNSYELHFILAPGLSVEFDGRTGRIIRSASHSTPLLTINTRISSNDSYEYKWKTKPWFVSPHYGSKIETTKLQLSLKGKGAIEITNLFSKANSET